MNSMRQIPHRKPPFYNTGTKRVSYKVFGLTPVADALHEQDVVTLKQTIIYSGDKEVDGTNSIGNPRDELEAAKSCSHWTIAEQGDKGADYKGFI